MLLGAISRAFSPLFDGVRTYLHGARFSRVELLAAVLLGAGLTSLLLLTAQGAPTADYPPPPSTKDRP